MRQRVAEYAGWAVVVVVVVAYAGALLALWPAPWGVKPNQVNEHRQAQQQRSAAAVSKLKDQPPAAAYEPRCPEDDKRHECFMQWRSARAAEAEAEAADKQLWWTRVGTGLAAVILLVTGWAAVSARQAAVATHTAAVAAEGNAATAIDALRTMQENAQRELRAYIFLEQASITDVRSPDGYKVSLLSKNFGSTPGRDYTHSIGIGPDVYPPPRPFPITVRAPARPQRPSFPPSGQLDRTCEMPALTSDEIARFNAGTLAIYVIGEMSYADVFGEQRRTWYRLYHNVESQASGRLRTDNEGNGYT